MHNNNKFLSLISKVDWVLFAVIIAFLFACKIFIPHILWVMNDIGRELYFPKLILENKVLYKDIFNLFGPFSYLFNAYIYKLFGSGLNVIYTIGYVTAALLISGIYFLSKEILSKNTAFVISLFTIVIGVTTIQNFNYCIPYSYAYLYGSISFVWSVYFYIKHLKTQSFLMFCLSSFFCGVAISNKYEFFIYGLLFLVFIIKDFLQKKELLRLSLLIILYFLPSITCYLYLIFQRLTLLDFINSVILVKSIIFTSGYKYLYTNMGTYISINNLRYCIISFVKIFIYLSTFYFAYKIYNKNKRFGLFLYIIPISLLLFCAIRYSYNNILCFFPILIFTLFVINIRNLDRSGHFVCLSALFLSLKVFWSCHIKYYGVFVIPLLIIAFFILTKKHKIVQKAFKLFLLINTLIILIYNLQQLDVASYEVLTKNEPIYTFKDTSWKINKVVKYINAKTKTDDKVVVYPEGQIINYITNRPTENFYYAMTPPYMELFGEDNVVKYFEKNPPSYFILTNEKMLSYNNKGLCIDYGYALCKFINSNYTIVQSIKYNNKDIEPYVIYKHN